MNISFGSTMAFIQFPFPTEMNYEIWTSDLFLSFRFVFYKLGIMTVPLESEGG